MTVQISVASADRVDAAAQLWAEATAARDGDDEIAPLDLSRPLIRSVLDGSPRSLLIAADDGDELVGFAAIEPWASESATAEIRYVGVSPRAWGAGVGRQLMAAVPGLLAQVGFEDAVLRVYVDNTRAVRLYESLGWRADGEPAAHPRSGRAEQQYRLAKKSVAKKSVAKKSVAKKAAKKATAKKATAKKATAKKATAKKAATRKR
jgi:ribosomal protein S18 acetylase RimI-like enzyme